MTMYLICSMEKSRHKRHLLWWRPESRGYTDHLDAAGLFLLIEAKHLASHHSFAVPEDVVHQLAGADKRVPASSLETLRMHDKAIRHDRAA